MEPPLLLHPSLPRAVGVLVLFGAVSLGAYLRGELWLAVPLAGVAVLWTATLCNLVVDDASITLAPIIPLLPRQRFSFENLGPFVAPEKFADRYNRGRGGFARVRAEIVSGRSYWSLYVIPLRTVTLLALYGPTYGSPPFEAPRLAEAIEARRRGVSEVEW